ncbi:MAG: hypothetical protein FRX49_11852 [Trebouxia sp. A1-2]|nr:MAG: hypothetical protein FRX49_11852 [Trebouxia sp. A1-2]
MGSLAEPVLGASGPAVDMCPAALVSAPMEGMFSAALQSGHAERLSTAASGVGVERPCLAACLGAASEASSLSRGQSNQLLHNGAAEGGGGESECRACCASTPNYEGPRQDQ